MYSNPSNVMNLESKMSLCGMYPLTDYNLGDIKYVTTGGLT